jgi:YebC/PmpR family DNA-binding regulatory protein
MSGHSKWSSIKHKKAKVDAKRGKMFTKCIREIIVSVKSGGPDAEANPALRSAISAAKSINMPNDNIDRAIKKAAGTDESVNYEEIIYEGYAPSGVAVIVECLTDNKNRAAADVRSTFSKYGGNLGASGCVSYMFNTKGLIVVPAEDGVTEDKLIELVLDVGGEDITKENDNFEIICEFTSLYNVKKVLEDNNINVIEDSVIKIPTSKVKLDDKTSEKVMKFLEIIEDLDDVQNVWANPEYDEEFLKNYDE